MSLRFDPLFQKYPSTRYPIYAKGGMVNCSSPQAAAAGLWALRHGGNAADAAAAAAAALTVCEPTANGIGGDAFALIWSEKDQKLYGLNSSGRAPSLASIDRVLADGTIRPVYFYMVDSSDFVASKLGDRGSLSARSIVTNVQDFMKNVGSGLGLYEYR